MPLPFRGMDCKCVSSQENTPIREAMLYALDGFAEAQMIHSRLSAGIHHIHHAPM